MFKESLFLIVSKATMKDCRIVPFLMQSSPFIRIGTSTGGTSGCTYPVAGLFLLVVLPWLRMWNCDMHINDFNPDWFLLHTFVRELVAHFTRRGNYPRQGWIHPCPWTGIHGPASDPRTPELQHIQQVPLVFLQWWRNNDYFHFVWVDEAHLWPLVRRLCKWLKEEWCCVPAGHDLPELVLLLVGPNMPSMHTRAHTHRHIHTQRHVDSLTWTLFFVFCVLA